MPAHRVTDPQIRPLPEDAYGEPLTYALAGALVAQLKDHPAIREHAENRAAWAYLAELDPLTKVALYWN